MRLRFALQAAFGLGAGLALSFSTAGCTRADYRRRADRETYGIVRERFVQPGYDVGRIRLEPDRSSRLADPYSQDKPPKPPDDPAAALFMERMGKIRGALGWEKHGVAPSIEPLGWDQSLARGADGKVRLDAEVALDIALRNSREYQTSLENVYLTALALTLDRFEFALRWFGRTGGEFSHFGTGGFPTESNTLTISKQLGFDRNFAAGGQLLVDFANSFVFEFAGGTRTASSNLTFSLLQPLLRGAGRKVRLESLTQSERDVLYAVRDFARFRKQFWADVAVRDGGYLGLLLVTQNIRNLQANLESQEQNLRLHDELFRGGKVSVVQVDQAFQSYQRARVDIVQAQVALQNALDGYKLRLGLPPRLEVTLDERALDQFQLSDPDLESLRGEIDEFQRARNRELDVVPATATIAAGFKRLATLAERGEKLAPKAAAGIEAWGRTLAATGTTDDPEQLERDRRTQAQFATDLPQQREGLRTSAREFLKAAEGTDAANAPERWEQLRKNAAALLAQVDQLLSVETQVRINAIQLPPSAWDEPSALAYAAENRLDLQNARAQVTDAWRKVEVTANALKADLDVFASANLAADPTKFQPFALSAAASTYRVGWRFDGPLNRMAERNEFRAAQIIYQRARRAAMAASDNVEADVRRDLRSLKLERLTFEIARQTLISAARQVEAARVRLLDPRNTAGTSSTLDILNALSSLLGARNALVGSYVNYETRRIQLLLDLEVLQLDAQGRPYDDAATDGNPEYAPADGARRQELLPATAGRGGAGAGLVAPAGGERPVGAGPNP
ncbi:MAG TPA: TolC family protein [Planctomycetia bacterium]|nr:TolC family protein [Planctomycetia bacterium]